MTAGKKKTPVILWVLLILLYCGIFWFSAQDGNTSGDISMNLSRQGVKFWDGFAGKGLNFADLEALAETFEHILRKGAHFAEYAVMGVLVYGILHVYEVPHQSETVRTSAEGTVGKMQGEKFVHKLSHYRLRRYLPAVLWVAASAGLDELHQYFVPGRWASVSDVLLDTCGGAVGVFLCAIYLSHKKKRSKHKLL